MLMRPLEAPPFPRPPYMTILTHTHTRDHHLHHHHPPPSHPPPHHHHHHCSNQTECKSLPGRGRSHTISYAKQQPLGVMQCNTMQHNMVMQCINVMQEMYLNAMQCMGIPKTIQCQLKRGTSQGNATQYKTMRRVKCNATRYMVNVT